ncbi:MAG: hypothetical protein SGI90_00070 [Candidatus Eisenbacteria bacterium]|nr:hypothetical protein [Candidatus Eisenbacteria bacterium]
MQSRYPAAIVLMVVVVSSSLQTAQAVDFDIPGTHPTMQAAVAAAAVSPDINNTITISVSPVQTNASIDIGAAFSPARRLVIRPGAALTRASIVNSTPGVTVVSLLSAANVTIQDLDILRNITNNNHIVSINQCEEILIERCRIGSNWTTPGTPSWANVRILYPTAILLRNNILFARSAGTFDYGINADSFNDAANSLRLYNNVVSDYRTYGIRIEAAIAGPLVLLRNNVVVNLAALVPEPVAYRTEAAGGGPTVITSHNVCFASAGFEETGAGGAQSIAGLASFFLMFLKPNVVPSFTQTLWTTAPPYDANTNMYRLVNGGPPHNAPGDYGMTVGNVGSDIAVIDDIEGDVRPGGPGPHTDRGADQLEPGVMSGIGDIDIRSEGLRAAVRRGPSGEVSLEYCAAFAGRLDLRIVDVGGRLLYGSGRQVEAASTGVFGWPAALESGHGVVFYRLTLVRLEGPRQAVSGKVIRGG